MKKKKIDKIKLNRMLMAGKSQREVAQFFGCSEAAVSKARKKLNLAVVKNVALETAHRVVDKNLNAIDQLYRINEEANKLLDDLEQTPELKLKIMSEIRGQLKLQLEIFSVLYDLKQVQAFQSAVLETIGEESPDARRKIIAMLKERSALRATLSVH